MTYVSKGLNFDHNWGTFVLHRGDGGRAIYAKKGEPIREVRVQFVAVFPSSTDPNVLFAVYRERGESCDDQGAAMGVSDRLPGAQRVRDLHQGQRDERLGARLADLRFAENHPGW